MIDVLGVLMGIDMQGFTREEGSSDLPPGFKEAPATSSSSTPAPTASSSESGPPTEGKSAPPVEEKEDAEMEDDDDDAKAKREAEVEKKFGSDAYRTRDFGKAAGHFEKAWGLWPKDVTFLTNLGGG